MIEGFEVHTARMNLQELKMAEYIAKRFVNHKGKAKAVTNTMIRNTLVKKFGKVGAARVRKILHHIRTADMVSCLVASSRGYYIAESSDEVMRYKKSLEDRIRAIQRLVKALKKQHDRRFTQGSLFEQTHVKKNKGAHHGSN